MWAIKDPLQVHIDYGFLLTASKKKQAMEFLGHLFCIFIGNLPVVITQPSLMSSYFRLRV